jgi:hypothetical protein
MILEVFSQDEAAAMRLCGTAPSGVSAERNRFVSTLGAADIWRVTLAIAANTDARVFSDWFAVAAADAACHIEHLGKAVV